jgi:hypothetical protein
MEMAVVSAEDVGPAPLQRDCFDKQAEAFALQFDSRCDLGRVTDLSVVDHQVRRSRHEVLELEGDESAPGELVVRVVGKGLAVKESHYVVCTLHERVVRHTAQLEHGQHRYRQLAACFQVVHAPVEAVLGG